MKEQSHKAEMSAALRGDFQRLRARGVDAALVPQDDDGPEEEPTAEPLAVVETPPAASAEVPSSRPPSRPRRPLRTSLGRRGWLPGSQAASRLVRDN